VKRALLVVMVFVSSAWAHEGDAPAVVSGKEVGGQVVVEGSVVVEGTVRQLKAVLLDVQCWPRVFHDARAVRPGSGDAPWSVDFGRFGHAHEFRVVRGSRGVVLQLAQAAHGTASLEYRLVPLDARRTTLELRYAMTAPPAMGPVKATAMLREKAEADLADFASAVSSGSGGKP
jgi:hypothetical protein